jgi:hypothetical protein
MQEQSVEQSPKQFQVKIDYNGLVKQLSINPHERVQSVLDRAENEFQITQNRHTLALFNASGAEVTDTQSVEEAGIKPGDELLLRPSRIKGGNNS